MVTWLDTVVDAPPDAPPSAVDPVAMQRVTREAAFQPATWTPQRAAKVADLFDGLADEWTARMEVNRYDAVADALDRGDPGTGTCLEVGSGTGLATPMLAAHFRSVVSLDLSIEMLRRGSGVRVQADAARLPLATGSIDCAVLVNAFLFPAELARVVAPSGTVVWVSTRGDETPIYLSPEDAAAALGWDAVAARAGLGVWSVLRRR